MNTRNIHPPFKADRILEPTPWRYTDLRRHSDAGQFRKYVEFEAFTRRDSLKRPRTTTKLLIAVIGIAVFATVGILAGFIER